VWPIRRLEPASSPPESSCPSRLSQIGQHLAGSGDVDTIGVRRIARLEPSRLLTLLRPSLRLLLWRRRPRFGERITGLEPLRADFVGMHMFAFSIGMQL
jgi:hypothetical protein